MFATDGGYVVELSEKGTDSRTIGSPGTGAGYLNDVGAIAADAHGHIWVGDDGDSRVQELNENGEWLRQIGNVTTPLCAGGVCAAARLTVDANGDLWVADRFAQRVSEFSETGQPMRWWGSSGTGDSSGTEKLDYPEGIAVAPSGDVWVSNWGDGQLEDWTAHQGVPAPPIPTEAFTVHYALPVTGAVAPYQMGAAQVGAWAQEDTSGAKARRSPRPTNRRAGRPHYKRASVYYLDEQGRMVNVASPSTAPQGSVSTTEYNEFNDVVRTLTAENRVRSLEAGSGSGPLEASQRSSEESKLLDTESSTAANRTNGPCHDQVATAEPGTS